MGAVSEAPFTILAIDDDPKARELVQDVFSTERDITVLTANDAASGLEVVRRRRPRLVLLDLVLPGASGMSALEEITASAPETDVILVTGHYSTDSAVEAILKGASDYLTKPLAIPILRERVGKLLDAHRRRTRASRLSAELMETCQFEGMVGRSPLMMEVFERIRRAAPHFRTVLLTGPTGTGKELVARAMHRLSPVRAKPLAVANCSAIVESLFESELFGHVKGAFTGAVADTLGLFEYASGGAVFLDEIGDIPLATQTKLLRVLENREYQRVGSPVARRTDVRIIAATNRNLREFAAQGRFRDDLYYRLSMIEIKLPSLSQRQEDLPLLERYFVERFSREYGKQVTGLTRRAEAALARHSWPGNVRELENAIGHACMMMDGDLIDVPDLPEQVRNPAPRQDAESVELVPMSVVERRHAAKVLAAMGGNKVQAAKVLEIHRATLARLLQDEDRQSAPVPGPVIPR